MWIANEICIRASNGEIENRARAGERDRTSVKLTSVRNRCMLLWFKQLCCRNTSTVDSYRSQIEKLHINKYAFVWEQLSRLQKRRVGALSRDGGSKWEAGGGASTVRHYAFVHKFSCVFNNFDFFCRAKYTLELLQHPCNMCATNGTTIATTKATKCSTNRTLQDSRTRNSRMGRFDQRRVFVTQSVWSMVF